MNFLFDFDETLVRGDVIHAVSKEMYEKKELTKIYTGKDVTTFELDGIPENLKGEVLKAFKTERFMSAKEPISEAYYFLCALKLNHHKISILTARPISLRNCTIVTLVQSFPKLMFDSINFCNNKDCNFTKTGHPDKKRVLKKLRPDFYFDDSIEYCNTASDLGIETYLISNSYTGWNKNYYGKLNSNIKVIKHIGKFDCRRL